MTGPFHSACVQCKSIHGDSGSHSNAVGWPSPFPLQAECPESVHRCQNKVFLFWIQFARTEWCPPTHLNAKDHIEAKWLVFWCCIWQCNVPDFWSCYFLILNLEAPVWHLEGPIWHLEAPIWHLEGPIWLLEGPIWLCILPEPGQKSAAVSFFSTEGGGQLVCSLEHNGGDSLLL